MKLGFIFDIRFYCYNGHYYTSNFSEKLWVNRYLKAFDDIVVIGRRVNIDYDPSEKMTQLDIEHVSFRCIDDVSRARRFINQHREAKFIEESIKDCDRVISRNWWGIDQCRKLKKSYMIEIISCQWDVLWYHSSILGKIAAVPNYLLMRRAVWNTPYVNYVTEKFLQKRYPTKGKTTSLCDAQLECVGEDVLSKRLSRIKEAKKPIIVGTVGSPSIKFKGQDKVIKALSILKKKGHSEYVYQIVGSGEGKDLMHLASELGVSDQVQIVGEVLHDKMVAWYDGLDIYLHPSKAEGLSRAIVEAEMRGLPCLVSSAGGNSELVDEECVFINKDGNEKEIASLLLEETREQMLKHSKRNFHFVKKYDTEKLNSQWVQMLNDFINER